MSLKEIGEFGLIDRIHQPLYQPEQVLVGIGDDCAVLPFDAQHYQVVSCDLLIEDVHFIRNRITPWQLGYKSVAVNLSDVAAMGGRPVHILLSVALPPDYTVEEWQGFYDGVNAICRNYSVNLIGGDTTSSKDRMTINVTVLGLVEQQHLHLRSHASVGDVIFVTGPLGGSRAGLELVLQEQLSCSAEDRAALLQCHCQPEPCCQEIAVLNRLAADAIHGLNDISDGLLSECRELGQASGVAMVIHRDQVPVHPACERLADQLGQDGLLWAMTGGEDYQLVGTMAADRADDLCARYFQETGRQLYLVGHVEAGSGVFLQQNGERMPASLRGYDHFGDNSQQAGQTAEEADGTVDEMAALRQLLEQQTALLQQQQEAQRRYRHDWNNHISCVAGLLACGRTAQAQTYLSQLGAAVPKGLPAYDTGRAMADVLLQQKAEAAKASGVELALNLVELGQLEAVSDYDLITLLGNLLDNGLEHCGQQEPYLYLDLLSGQEGRGPLLRMENSCPGIIETAQGLVTEKADRENHGKGLQQLQQVMMRYGGAFTWQYDAAEGRFVSNCQFPREIYKKS